ncbi:ABC transporter permease [Sorangium cellulosum]|uniref:ABC transporter permease n=1 Tax=Sorangium cellulosum TaxID=56 RepID=A0A2L0EYT0_SORCE|nr:ABC transporter permease [Sorangium cellulosum]AUX44474.1 ABC transporter permease [Sorangium cellulosum]
MASLEQSIALHEQAPQPDLLSDVGRRLGRAVARSWILLLVAAIWETAPRVGLVEAAFLPPLSEVLETGWQLLRNGQLLSHIKASLSRSLLGFSLAILIGVPLGLAIGWYKAVADAINPLLEVLRNTAALALLPVFLLLLGIGEASKVALVIYSCTWPILLNTISGVRGVDPLLIKSARTMGLSPLQLFRKVILPAAVPTVFVGIRLAGAYSLLVLVAAEMIGAKAGLGYLIIYAQYNFQIPSMYVGIVTITALGLTFNQLLMRLEQRFTAWKVAPKE